MRSFIPLGLTAALAVFILMHQFTGPGVAQQGRPLYGPLVNVPQGGIILWSGLLADIPSGWLLCDGSNGTPDLTSKFVVSVASGVDPGTTGGTSQHGHSANTSSSGGGTTSAPDQIRQTSSLFNINVAGPDHRHQVLNHAHSVSVTSVNHLPPYYEIAFIMRE